MDDGSGMCFTTSKQGNKSIHLSVASWLAWWGLKGIGVYTGLCRLIKSWFDLYSGLFDQKHGSSVRILLVPEDNARPSCFPDGPSWLEHLEGATLGKSVRSHSCLRPSLSCFCAGQNQAVLTWPLSKASVNARSFRKGLGDVLQGLWGAPYFTCLITSSVNVLSSAALVAASCCSAR